ncbi:DNA circularization N-terminal domain-containing protein [Bradyrhizobium japonicum]|uniref:DNA circularization N-terminal domain-containing protein n=1 Tax=Bradyrhizobium japonicum TaxID=375 RepID=UPI00209F93DD|nr:DNA circularization N-terminal domain-containing protein [Bradyrhizobium japonicum]MCP1761944.1 prophage DNA circulation protein [Bradyrhizobium japonicum]MCP1793524.1 prophage DNA circulation protein [Bradyrhizobium japonicum]MCP1805957.1 prophage DNA circulation protein [Bradyrhizobium japonicum]MCP1812360.1 prophage DNA circulation protein [Bradyrhizobium japonicum]MCP1873597.1 prophage DNA circulation protein [Bradyrhizobium japonicum]
MQIRDVHNPWRDRYQTASFRGAFFHVETDARASGRRVVLHEYPKRDDPYAEDMGRAARRFQVQGYLIGPNYLQQKDALVSALEADGPGTLRLPMPYMGEDIDVMAGPYTVTETREKGGMCALEMDFIEYGTPGFEANAASVDTQGAISNAARGVEAMTANMMESM